RGSARRSARVGRWRGGWGWGGGAGSAGPWPGRAGGRPSGRRWRGWWSARPVPPAGRATSGGCSPTSSTPMTGGLRRWGCESKVSEADPSLFGAAQLHVADLLGGYQDLPALVVADHEHAAVAERGQQRALDLVGGGGGVHHAVPGDGLDSYLDFHVGPFPAPRARDPCPGASRRPRASPASP